jgi:hypothetical protein|tara:strand:+ start:1880 stop:2296 length:417 start_codon:yes stop_codon:yes gene_type:complete
MNLDNLQRAIFSKLTNDTALMALIVGVYADHPQDNDSGSDAPFPYVTIGQDRGQSFDTNTNFGAIVTCQIDTWTRSGNFLTAKAISNAIRKALHYQPLIILEASHTMTIVQSEDFMKDPDGKTKHGVLQALVMFTDIT